MIQLSTQEQLELQNIQNQQQEGLEFIKISILIHLLGGLFGWLSLVIFLVMTGLPLGFVSTISLLCMGILMWKSSTDFLSPSLSIVFMIASHVTFMITLSLALHLQGYMMFIVETIIFAVSYFYYHHKTYLFLQSGLWFAWSFIMAWEYGATIYMPHILFFLSHVLLIYLWLTPPLRIPYARIGLMLAQSFFLYIYYFQSWSYHDTHAICYSKESFTLSLSIISSLVLSSYLFYTFKSLRSSPLTIAFIVAVSIMNIYLQQPFALILLFLALSYAFNERLTKYLALTIFSIFLFSYYYMLSISFSDKALVLMMSGMIFLAMAYTLKRLKVLS